MLKSRLLKLADKVVGSLAVLCIARSPQVMKMTAVRSILFIRPGGIGDAALLIPSILAFRDRYPAARITVLAEKRNGAVFGLCPAVDELFIYDRPDRLLKALKGKYDMIIDTEQWHRLSAVVARLSNAPVLIGYATNERKRAFTHPVPYSHNDYELKSFMKLLIPLGAIVDYKHGTPFLSVPALATESVRKLLGVMNDKTFIAIFPGASISEKCWSVDKFQRLAQRIQSYGIPAVVLGGKECMNDGGKIINGNNSTNLAGRTSLMETAAILAKSSLLVCGDSALLHIAVGLGTPTVSLFGPSNIKKWAPESDGHLVISKNLPCSPCSKFGYTPKCPINAKCMSDINVDEVYDAVLRLLEKKRESPREG